MDKSLCEYFYSPDESKGHKCGYCKAPEGSVSQGMWAHKLTCEDYQDMIDRGWRRSGKYCYKPIMDRTCCPLYCIRCEAADFKLSHSHKSVLKKMSNYLVKSKGADEQIKPSSDSSPAKSEKKAVQPGSGADPAKAPCRKAKMIRQEKRQAKAAAKQASIGDTSTNDKPSSTDCTGSSKTADIFKIGPDGRKPIEMFLDIPEGSTPHSHKLEIKLIQSSPPSSEFKATFSTSYQLFKKYQMAVHQEKEEDCDEKGFRRFLCDSPLTPGAGPSGWPCGYGSYHQHYLIDGKLVAVGVIDILPNCLSSVYVYYDVDYNFLSLGVYSALQEITMTRSLYVKDPDRFKYYYMGYYVHSCPKMRYKGEYTPSFLLCPKSYRFVPIETCLPKIEASKYSRLCDEDTAEETPNEWFNSIIVLFQKALFPYEVLTSIVGGRFDAKVKEWASFVGPNVGKRMILVLS